MKRINLLPKLKQNELAHEKLFYSIAVAAVIGVAILLFGVLVQVGVRVYLDRSLKSVNEQIEQMRLIANKSENAAIKQEIQLVNAQINDFAQLTKQTPQWSSVLAAFVRHVPEGVKITQFEAKTLKSEISISGYSPSRDLVIDLYNNINADKENFKNINYPLENVTQPTNVKFFFDFSVADGVLLKGAK
jgi:Tfp pilus assembly protein PilN